MNDAFRRRLDDVEKRYAFHLAARGRRTKAVRDAAVQAVLSDPEAVRSIMVGLVGEGSPGFVDRRVAVITAAMRADT